MKALFLLILCAATVVACGRDPTSPYSDPDPAGPRLWLPAPLLHDRAMPPASPPARDDTVSGRELNTGDDAAIVSSPSKRPGKPDARAAGRHGRTLLI